MQLWVPTSLPPQDALQELKVEDRPPAQRTQLEPRQLPRALQPARILLKG
jgi:hypothetical protein